MALTMIIALLLLMAAVVIAASWSRGPRRRSGAGSGDGGFTWVDSGSGGDCDSGDGGSGGDCGGGDGGGGGGD